MTDSTQSTTSFIKPGTKNLTDESSFTSLANANAHRPLPPTHVANPLYGNTLTNGEFIYVFDLHLDITKYNKKILHITIF